ncbi:tRNA glutamyl-Q(34) synthetase GluQRS [Microbulbifer thermotolerans]|uniref:tRNA glutamyl-Q(34) synthetase GluQRS n=1 Tax=Microbulbifer thermotolerans TaxID=252514 RepID=UPI0022487756|nr:tRNA glutamyl-Q(34) synthetase GluQRS [Microbulbifer thermotolerans]MCX2793555.1 tRNA glutamyl-Q(34) synthetase GluQRS [Microbulbifer thermotolerans]
MNAPTYIGRFAPSPTGPLHFGSLVCALGSYLDAIAHGGRWLVRMEDLDPPREEPGAAERILHSLEAHGLHWHGPLQWQSRRHALYEEILTELRTRKLLYPCHCSRSQIRRNGGHDNSGCRARCGGSSPAALRLVCAGGEEQFHDIWRGQLRQQIREDTILKRRDGLYAYQLAVVADDIDQGVTHVVRGADLLDTTGAQQRLFHLLGATPPQFGHLPLVMGPGGLQKLSKQNHAPPIDDHKAADNLSAALAFLGFHLPRGIEGESPEHILHWAAARWQRHQVDLRNRQITPPDSIAFRR